MSKKTWRPTCPGFIVLYVLSVVCLLDCYYSTMDIIHGTASEFTASFTVFTYLILIVAVLYDKLYIASRVEISSKEMRIVYPIYIRPGTGVKRVSFIYRQGALDIRQVNRQFPITDIVKYGFAEDLGFQRLDRSGSSPTNRLFPVHEIVLVVKDGKRYHLNIAFYSMKNQKAMMQYLRQALGFAPEGALCRWTGDAPDLPEDWQKNARKLAKMRKREAKEAARQAKQSKKG